MQTETKENTDSLLYGCVTKYTHKEASDYYRSLVTEPMIKKSNIIFCIIFCAMALFVAVMGGAYLILVFALFFVFFTLGTPYLIQLIRRTRQYLKAFSFWNRTVRISLYEEHVEYEVIKYDRKKWFKVGRKEKKDKEECKRAEVFTDKGEYKGFETFMRSGAHEEPETFMESDKCKNPEAQKEIKKEPEKIKKTYYYEDFYKIHEAGTRIYLTAGPTGIIILDTEKTPPAILEAIKDLAEEKKEPNVAR
jgi:hypothetical protein